MNKRMRKKALTKRLSNKDYIKYWKKAYKVSEERLTKELNRGIIHVDMLCDAAEKIMRLKNSNSALESTCIKYRFEVGKLNLQIDKLRLQMEEAHLPWWKRWLM